METKTNEPKIFSQDLTDDDLITVLDSELQKNTLVGHHISSFNNFMSTGINQIVTQLFQVEKSIQNERTRSPEDNTISLISFLVKFNDIRTSKPITRMQISGKPDILLPNYARKHNLNYSSPLMVDATITAKAFPKDGSEPKIRTEEVKDFQIASMPIMVGSKFCHLSEMSKEAKKMVEEDPNDPGGYFILKGGEWVISMIETRLYNCPHIFRNVGHEKEIARLEFISKPGDAYENSSELIMRYLQGGNIFLNFTSNSYLKLIQIPFYILFRIMGMTTDKEIIDNIIYGYSTPENKDVVSDHMLQILKKAFRASDPDFSEAQLITDQTKLLDLVSKRIAMNVSNNREIDENLMKYLNANLLKIIDKIVFPHIGLAGDTRHRKLRYLGHLIHKLLLVEMQIVNSTDRDSLKNKRINAAGRAYAKAFKTQFNLAVIQAIKKKLTKDFKSVPFSQVQLAQSFKSAIHGPDLEKALIQAIVTGNKELTVKNRQIPNRLASEMLHRKNQLNVLSTLNVIRTPSTSASKQDQRADEMRRVHPSYTGYIDPIQSADTGEQVGMVKQKTIGSSLLEASSSELLKEILLKDPEIIPSERVFPEKIHKYDLCKVLVNGDWIGCCADSPRIMMKYKEIRRGWRPNGNYSSFKPGTFKFIGNDKDNLGIDSFTTIYWDTEGNEINFWVDAGRMIRPLLIIRNNGELDPIGQEIFKSSYDPVSDPEWDGKWKPGCFVQDILIGPEEIRKLNRMELTIEDLHMQGIIDYISPEEMENCFICPSLDVLKENRYNPLLQYTHLEIPAGLFGLPALTCPYAAHNQPPRITFQTNQTKQTTAWYSLAWPFRTDKHAFLAYYCQVPLIKTLANNYIYPNGANCVVAIDTFTGFNMEDSLIFNRTAADRGSYKGLAFNYIKTELEKDEKFGNPEESNTIIEKKNANYSKIQNGFVKKGTMLKKDDVIIGKLYELPKPIDHKIYKDVSILYPNDEPAMVEGEPIKAQNNDDEEFVKVKFSSVRPLGIGSKFCLTPDHEVLTTEGWISIDKITMNHKVATLEPNGNILYQSPIEILEFDHNDEILEIPEIGMKMTLNHRVLYTERAWTDNIERFLLTEVRNLLGKRVYFKSNCINPLPDIKEIQINNFKNIGRNFTFSSQIEIDAFIWFLGIFLTESCIGHTGKIRIYVHKDRVRQKILEILPILGFEDVQYDTEPNVIYLKEIGIKKSAPNWRSRTLIQWLKRNCYNMPEDDQRHIAIFKKIPDICFRFSQRQSKLLVLAMCYGDGSLDKNGIPYTYSTASSELVDGFQRIILHAGLTCKFNISKFKGEVLSIKGVETVRNADLYICGIRKEETRFNYPEVYINRSNIKNYNGKVHCITVSNGIFYIRNKLNKELNSYTTIWNGNSSRAGQKGMSGLGLKQWDLPFTKQGISPTLILNPHAIPSRMTIGQIVEGLAGKAAALQGAFSDATIFRKLDLNSIGDILEDFGFNRYGTEHCYNGMTGEPIDKEIFICPTYYQRLQKFVVDEVYSISSGPTSALTRQPIEGRSNSGGLRLGEMENNVIISHGAAHFIMDKFRESSDNFDIYVCRTCGKRPVVNEQKSIIICNTCQSSKLDPDIVKVKSTWSSKLFLDEIMSTNIGISLGVSPYIYESSKE